MSRGQATRGFTLLEILIAVTIVALLAAVAMPAYNRHLDKTRRTDGTTALLETAHMLERCYARAFSFLQDDGCAVELPRSSSAAHYEITAATRTRDQYVLHAHPQGMQARDAACGVLTLTHRGERGSQARIGEDENACW